MDSLFIKGPCRLSGEVTISSSKNAALPILAGVLLCKNKVSFDTLPGLRDINTINSLLSEMGVKISKEGNLTHYEAPDNVTTEASYELVKKMRASILVLGPLLSRFKKAKVSLPGGCAIGTRPIDIHLQGLEQMGAQIKVEKGYVEAETSGLVGAKVSLPFPSVGATENLVMAAVFAKGETTIENAAKEPEIVDLCDFLSASFSQLEISGAGTDKIVINGITGENISHTYTVIPDRIEAATFLIAGLITRSNIKVLNCNPTHIESVTKPLEEMGAKLVIGENFIEVQGEESNLVSTDIETAPYPAFPTDVQAQFLSLLTSINEKSVVTESIFENRFMHVPELNRMGADIKLQGRTAIIKGGKPLTGAPVMCTDLRASAALVLAGLTASGETRVQRVYHIDRGYESIDKKFQGLGANIERVNEPME